MNVKYTLNTRILENLRKEKLYKAIITDLTIAGYIKAEDAKLLLGTDVPSYVKLPDGRNIDNTTQSTIE